MLAPLTVEALSDIFHREECPYWWAFSDKGYKQKVGQFRRDEGEDNIMEDSWDQLEYLMLSYSYGHIYIKCKKNPSDNDASTHFWNVRWGEENRPTRGFSTNRQAQAMGNGMSGGGMNSNMMMAMFQMMMNQKEATHKSEIDSLKENLRLNFKHQRLLDEVSGTVEPSIQEYALKEGIEFLKGWVTPKINPSQFQQPQQAAALGTMGQRTEQPPAQATSQSTARPPSTSFDAVMQDVNTAYLALGKKYTPNEITRVFAIFCQQNSDAADQFIGPLILQLRQHGQQTEG